MADTGSKKEKLSKWSIYRLSSLIGGMSLFASILELFNVGRFLEVALTFSAQFAFSIELAVAVVIPLIIRKLYHSVKSSNEKKGGKE